MSSDIRKPADWTVDDVKLWLEVESFDTLGPKYSLLGHVYFEGEPARHPPIPKKPAIASKPSVNKPPVVAARKNGIGKSPVPKPKPRTPPKSKSLVGSPTTSVPNRNGIPYQPQSEEEKCNGVMVTPGNSNGNLISSECLEQDVGLVESSKPLSPIDIFKDDRLQDDPSAKNSDDQAPPLSPIDIFKEDSKNQSVLQSNENRPPGVQEKKFKKQPPPLKPRNLNPNLPARRTKSAVVQPISNESESKTGVFATKSVNIVDDEVIFPEQKSSDDTPTIPARKKRLSMKVSPSFDVSKAIGSSPLPTTRRKPLKECKTKAVIEEAPPEIIIPVTENNELCIEDSAGKSNLVIVNDTSTGLASEIKKNGAGKKSPVLELDPPPVVARRAKPNEVISTAPVVERRTDVKTHLPNKVRAKSEYIKSKPGRPPPPAVKPLSVAPSNGSTPPPKHPKPTVRKAKSQCLPSDTSLPFTSIDITDYSKEADSPMIPARSKNKTEAASDADNVNSTSSHGDFVLKKIVFGSKTNTIIESEISRRKEERKPSPTPEPSRTGPKPPRKSLPPPVTKSKTQPKLQRSLTEPEIVASSKGFHDEEMPTRKAPPIPIKPIQSSGGTNNSKNDKDSSKSPPISPSNIKPVSPSMKSPPLSPKSPNGLKPSPKHRPQMPPPPPPVERTQSMQLPEPSRRITSRSQSLDVTCYDPNGNIQRTSKSTVENENAKNAINVCFSRNSASNTVQSISESSSITRSSIMSEDDDYVLPDPDPQSPPLSPRKLSNSKDDQLYQNKQVASVRPSRRVAPPRPVKPVMPQKIAPSSPTVSPSHQVSPYNGSPGKLKPPPKPVRRSLSINSDISDGYEDMSKGSSLASSLGIVAQMSDLYSVPRSCEHTLHESGNCSCAQQYANVVSSGDEDDGSISDEEEERYEKFKDDKDEPDGLSLGDVKGNRNKTYLVAKEIRDSERVFVDVLKLLNKDFRQAIDDAGTKEGRPVIEQLLLHQILGHLPQLHQFNQELLADLDSIVDNWSEKSSISGIFLIKGPYLKLYSSYIRDFEKITTVFDEACGRFPLFGAAVREFELSERCQNLAIKHYMLKPIQRIPQYKMLLTDYLKQLEAGTKEHAETSAALNIVSEVANHANECMRQGDNFGKLLQIQHSLIGNHEIVKPGRVFIKEGELLKLSRKVMQPRKFFLMSDILLYTTPFPPGQYKLNNVLSLAGMRVNKPQLGDFKNEFNIISVQRSFTLSASTPEERDEWIQALTSTITDYATKRSSFSVLQPQLVEGDTSSLGRKAPIWIPDSRVTMCMICTCEFTVTWRRHHCRACGKVVCGNCSMNKVPLMYLSQKTARVCEQCFNFFADEDCTEDDGTPNKERKFKSKRKRSLKETRRPSALKEVSANESDTNMSGYLYVKRKKDWKRMWFVLKGKVLYTYKASEDVAALESMPLLGYEVKTVDEYFEGTEPGLVLQLFHQGRIMSVFRTESKAAAEKWAYAMADATVL